MIEKRRAVRTANRPDIRPRNQGVLFHNTGATGWGRIRHLGDYKQGRSEHDFRDQHDRFTEEQV
jgi:hypothetical protein